ncbi:Tyrosinase-like protein orsC [Penicillium angulare]|uniref:Tyrosinase-like protein orsC n=1 Tax=Penicillium angulare TaxID=116970 RepID=UPI00254017A8|nr:Tyrosinase-like protein orsC [Penicillium angulare]KAJ5287732.1 Tyrosinase-like protein orsC [Penicillium angulare]
MYEARSNYLSFKKAKVNLNLKSNLSLKIRKLHINTSPNHSKSRYRALRNGSIGLHSGGHYAIGGDPGNDADGSWGSCILASPWNDRSGVFAVAGTETYLNRPASPNVTLETMVNVGYVDKNRSIVMKDIMSTTGRPFCYAYT